MQIQVRLFAIHRERLGTDRLTLDLPAEASVSELIGALVARFPAFESLGAAARIAVNREYASLSTILHDGDEVALIPPVAGGGD